MKLLPLASLLLIVGSARAGSFDSIFDFHLTKQFDSSIDNGGKVGVSRYGAELRIDYHFTDDDDFQLRFQYQRDDWDFSGTSGMGNDDPWDLVTTVDLALQWTHQLDNKTQIFGGPIIKWSGDSDAQQSESDVFGGMVGFAHVFSDTFVLGAGVGVIESLEDDSRLFPILVLDWKINDALKLTSDITTRYGSRIGAELVWNPRDDWTLGAGISYDYTRFRLDDAGYAPDGVGEATSLPIHLRATFHSSASVDITVLAGFVFSGELSVFDSSGTTLQTESYDPSGAIGLLARIRF
ncbi:MAG: hypothetical protein QF444_00520 [Phycisphaerales bacterium]|jgi:hypothetical protein|nr:hypothetical protein [Phycisphaerales bacterium]MDP6692782.1 hypothetical protein [Phycisphaerales bacterium]